MWPKEIASSAPLTQSSSKYEVWGNILYISALPAETQQKIDDILKKISELYKNPTEQKNQRDKFLWELNQSNKDGWNDLILDDLKKWGKVAAAATADAKVATADAKVATADAKVATADAKVFETGKIRIVANIQSNESEALENLAIIEQSKNLTKYKEEVTALTAKVTDLSGGKPLTELIPDYTSKVASAERELRSLGKDPSLAAGMVLIANEAEIIQKIPADKKAELQKDFASLRSNSSLLGLPSRTPTEIARDDPKVSLEAYRKIKVGFEPPTTPVYLRNGELQSQTSLGPNRTIMNLETGARVRERSGLRIESSVPAPESGNELQTEIDTKQTNINRDRARAPAYLNGVATLLERVDPTVRTPLFDTLRKDLTGADWTLTSTDAARRIADYTTTGEFRSLPDWVRASFLSSEWLIAKYIQTLQKVEADTKIVGELKKKLPDIQTKEELKRQDAVVDTNLITLIERGYSRLGQTNYELIVKNINDRLRVEAKTPINSSQEFTEAQKTLLSRATNALAGRVEWEISSNRSLDDTELARLSSAGMSTLSDTRISTVLDQVFDHTRK